MHQQAFDALLKLNRKSLMSYSERSTCTVLAEQIVSTQKLLRSVCPVIDGFWVNFLHLFGATLTLTISLLLDNDMDPETRDRRRSKVQMALTTMRETPGSQRGSRIIEILLKEEQKQWDTDRSGTGASRRPLDLASLTRRIVAQNSELGDASLRSDSGGLIPMPIEHVSADHAAPQRFPWDRTPDESVIPSFASSWGDPTDPTGIISSFHVNPHANFYEDGIGRMGRDARMRQPTRPYEHSLRPWQEPVAANQNDLWDWVFSQAALLHGPEPPVEGDPKSRRHSRSAPSPKAEQRRSHARHGEVTQHKYDTTLQGKFGYSRSSSSGG